MFSLPPWSCFSNKTGQILNYLVWYSSILILVILLSIVKFSKYSLPSAHSALSHALPNRQYLYQLLLLCLARVAMTHAFTHTLPCPPLGLVLITTLTCLYGEINWIDNVYIKMGYSFLWRRIPVSIKFDFDRLWVSKVIYN